MTNVIGMAMAGHETRSKIRWNESTARNIHADVCTVAASREAISLLFGIEKTPLQADQAETIQLTDRIILNPFVAKQLAAALEQVIRDYESSFGALVMTSRRPTDAERKEKGAVMFRLVEDLDVEIGLEHSCKIVDKTLLSNRFLLGVSKKEIEHNAQERIIRICKRLDMPQPLLETFRQCLVDANYVHFGFEESEATCLYKVYVEFWDSIKEDLRRGKDTSRPFLLHLGFKWDAFDNKIKAVTRYTWHPWISVADIYSRLGAILDSATHGFALEIARNIVSIAAARIPHQDILYLEVTEEDNPRRSFDINVYRAGLQVRELYPLLSRLGQHYEISHAEFHHLYDRIKTKRFGHLSGGVSREGKDFFTVYYGVEPVYGDKRRQARRIGDSLIAPTRLMTTRHTVLDQPIEKEDEHAASLLELVKNLHVPFGFERSFKIMEKTLLSDRFLTGIKSEEMGPEQHESILNICRQIHMPEDFEESFRNDLQRANVVLFGFEKNEAKRYYKVYLEFSNRIREVIEENPDAPRPFLLFVGFKWDASDNSRKVVTHYTFYPSFVLRDMADRIARLFYRKEEETPYRIVEGILDLAAQRAGPNDFLYLEVIEEGNPRRSFDINVYKPDLQMAEIYPWLLEMARHYSIATQQFNRMYETTQTHILGHVAGGIDREGRDFLTLYFSEKGDLKISRMGHDPVYRMGRSKRERQQN